jgi:hypothetical protein
MCGLVAAVPTVEDAYSEAKSMEPLLLVNPTLPPPPLDETLLNLSSAPLLVAGILLVAGPPPPLGVETVDAVPPPVLEAGDITGKSKPKSAVDEAKETAGDRLSSTVFDLPAALFRRLPPLVLPPLAALSPISAGGGKNGSNGGTVSVAVLDALVLGDADGDEVFTKDGVGLEPFLGPLVNISSYNFKTAVNFNTNV